MADMSNFTFSDNKARYQVYATDTTSGQITELIRELDLSDPANPTVSYIKADDGTAYTPAASEVIYRRPQRVSVGSEILANVGSTVASLTVPANAKRAEVHVWDEAAVFTADGTNPDPANKRGRRANNGAVFELEGADLDNFKAVALDAAKATTLYVEYFNGEDPFAV